MKKFMLLMLILAVAATGAIAKEKVEYTCSDLTVLTDDNGDRVGGDTIATATVIGGLPYTDGGDTSTFTNDYDVVCPYTGSTAPDVVYSFTPAGDVNIDADLCGSSYDTKLYITDSAMNVIACNDDSCPGYMSEVFGVALTGGETYYIFVDGYGSSSGAYVLNVDGVIVVPPPANDVCAGAINLDEMAQSFVVDTCDGYTNAYSDASACTNYSANGADAVYYAVLPENGQIDVCIDGGFDLSLYLVTDCGDIAGSCVAGDDSGNPECISYSGGPGTYYLIVDG
ncbi:MAG: hypothetical protein GY722_24385, partial [bacterium]|nr:hypothetical protein [bacterium]